MNRESSRSHAVFTMTIKSMVGCFCSFLSLPSLLPTPPPTPNILHRHPQKNLHGNIKHICKARLNLIDLAGSERQKDTKVGEALVTSISPILPDPWRLRGHTHSLTKLLLDPHPTPHLYRRLVRT